MKMITLNSSNVFIFTLMVVITTNAFVTESRKLDPNNSNDDDSRPSITTYDQRQTGKYNVHVNIKDVKIISVDGDKFDGEFGDDTIYDYGDYDYDPAHLTVNPLPIFGGATSTKPPKSTTKTPVSITTTKQKTTTTEPTKPPVTTSEPPKTTKPTKLDNSTQILSVHTTHIPSASNIYIFKPTPNYHPNPVHYDYQEIPVEVIVEPVLKPKYRSANTRITANRHHHYRTKPSSTDQLTGSVVHYVHSGNEATQKAAAHYETSASLGAKACAKGEYRNRTGKCRERRSGIQTPAA
ncbi:uncharacterized protein LOC129777622 isoform X2 [Toxorhynchites rutilus septentrionalis]|uniref:uncharacterized protein LOC129777622 isoform X2 n=1 Tax=Toxorhynchites rutilus septentrionalis TaxID=329112 RepID=UPI002478A04B|nr:uncharacterized protein LOC129777622 isoform X2 [Toxorhynchites rutilus septentrionalis]